MIFSSQIRLPGFMKNKGRRIFVPWHRIDWFEKRLKIDRLPRYDGRFNSPFGPGVRSLSAAWNHGYGDMKAYGGYLYYFGYL